MQAGTPTKLQPAPAWQVWLALWTVYIVWGSTYLGIRVVVESAPPLLSTGTRFFLAGAIVYAWLRLRRGREAVRLEPRLLGAAAVVGCLLIAGPALVAIVEQEAPSHFAALIFASIPLWIVMLRALFGERPRRSVYLGVLAGYAGVAILVLPGDRPTGVDAAAVALLLLAALSWAIGSFWSRHLPVPRDAFLATAATTVCGGIAAFAVGLGRGEASDLHLGAITARSWIAFAYLILVGSVIGFSAYVWALKHAPISKVATYAYVNPVVALFLGWAILSEDVTASSLIGAAVIVASVAWVVSREGEDATPAPEPEGEAYTEAYASGLKSSPERTLGKK